MNRAGMADGGEKSQKPAQASPVWEAAMAGAVPTHLWGRPHPWRWRGLVQDGEPPAHVRPH